MPSFQVELSWHANIGQLPWALEPSKYWDSLTTIEKWAQENINDRYENMFEQLLIKCMEIKNIRGGIFYH